MNKFKNIIRNINNRELGYKFELLDENDNYKFALLGIENANVEYDSLDKIHSSIAFQMTETAQLNKINFLRDRVKPIIIINSQEYPLGIFLLNSSVRKLGNYNMINRPIIGYSKLQILKEDKVDDRFYIAKGVKYVDIIQNIITSSVDTKIIIDDDSENIIDIEKEFEIGTPKLDIINQLLQEINYEKLWVDFEGYFHIQKYIHPIQKKVDFEYKTDSNSVISADINEKKDTYGIANKFIRYVDNADKTERLRSVYVNNNPNSDTSVQARGRVIVDADSVEDIVDQKVLDAYTERVAYDLSNVYKTVKINTAIIPLHLHKNIINLDVEEMGLKGKYEETAWKIDFKLDNLMSHTLREVVY